MANNPDRASYFPAIEKKHGQPMSYWFAVMEELSDKKYPEQIAYLRENHGFSQAHANALVMYSRGSKSAHRVGSFDQYLEPLDEDQVKTIRSVFDTIQKTYPDLELVIAWNKPILKVDGKYIFGVAAQKNYILLAPFDGEVIEQFRSRLAGYKVNKKTFQIPSDWDVDERLLLDMVQASLATSGVVTGP